MLWTWMYAYDIWFGHDSLVCRCMTCNEWHDMGLLLTTLEKVILTDKEKGQNVTWKSIKRKQTG